MPRGLRLPLRNRSLQKPLPTSKHLACTVAFTGAEEFKARTLERCRLARGEVGPPPRCKASGSRLSADSARGRHRPRSQILVATFFLITLLSHFVASQGQEYHDETQRRLRQAAGQHQRRRDLSDQRGSPIQLPIQGVLVHYKYVTNPHAVPKGAWRDANQWKPQLLMLIVWLGF